MEKFDNKDRTRYYGLRIGDLVKLNGVFGKEFKDGKAEVVDYGSDNNRVQIKSEKGFITDWVAEWCDIVTKVEDRNRLVKVRYKKTDNYSGCCDAPIKIKVSMGEGRYSSMPYCTKCKKFPAMSKSDKRRLRKLIKEGTLFD